MEAMNLVYLLLVLVLVGGVVFNRGMAHKNMQAAAIWGMVLLVLVLGYRAYQRFNATPRNIGGSYAMIVPFNRYHQGFVSQVNANNQTITALFDTGASSTVLSYQDAERVGINMDGLRFNKQVSTANGTTFMAGAVLDTLAFGDEVYGNLPITIAPDDALDISLIGMDVMRQFSGFYVGDNKLHIEF